MFEITGLKVQIYLCFSSAFCFAFYNHLGLRAGCLSLFMRADGLDTVLYVLVLKGLEFLIPGEISRS